MFFFFFQNFQQHELISADDASKKKSTEIDVQIAVHYGTPYTASTMAFDPIQRLLAIGTLWVYSV